MSPPPVNNREGGFILVVVLGAVLVLSALLFGFNQSARLSLKTADAFCQGEQAWNGAWAGLQVAVAAVRDANDLCMHPLVAESLPGDSTFSIGEAHCSVTVCDESGLLNVNRLKGEQGQLNRPLIDQFLRLIDLLNRRDRDQERIGYGIVPSIIDWVDPDSETTHLEFVKNENTGAEDDHYRMRSPVCPCRNKPVEIVDDLLPVRRMSPENLGRLRPYLTCAGDGKININAAPKLIVESLSEQIDGALAEMIVSQRRRKPFATVAALRKVPGMTDNIYQSIRDAVTVRADERYYRVTSHGNLGDRKTRIEAILWRNPRRQNVDIIYYREL